MKELIKDLQGYSITKWEQQFLSTMTRIIDRGLKISEFQLIHTWDIAVKYEYIFN